jgi:acid phosphatase class B
MILTALFAAGCGNVPVKNNGNVSGFRTNEVVSSHARIGFALDDVLVDSAQLFDVAAGIGLTNGSDAWWAFINTNGAHYGRLKLKTLSLVQAELAKGSLLYVVIGYRRNVEGAVLVDWLSRSTGIPRENIYFEPGNKAARMVDLKLDTFYGATDQDMEEALASGVKPVRILRSPTSRNPLKATPGAYLEEIVPDSAE